MSTRKRYTKEFKLEAVPGWDSSFRLGLRALHGLDFSLGRLRRDAPRAPVPNCRRRTGRRCGAVFLSSPTRRKKSVGIG